MKPSEREQTSLCGDCAIRSEGTGSRNREEVALRESGWQQRVGWLVSGTVPSVTCTLRVDIDLTRFKEQELRESHPFHMGVT